MGKLEKQQTEPGSTKPAERKKDSGPGGLSQDRDQVFASFHEHSQDETLMFAGEPAGHSGPFVQKKAWIRKKCLGISISSEPIASGL